MFRITVFILFTSMLHAEGIPEEKLGAIYTEALWFVGVIGVMAVISFVVSSRNAKRYEEQLAREKREVAVEKEKVDEVMVTPVDEQSLEDGSSVDRLLELSQLHKEGLLSEAEFMVFKKELYRELKEMHR